MKKPKSTLGLNESDSAKSRKSTLKDNEKDSKPVKLKKRKPLTKLEQELSNLGRIPIEGMLLAVDPSSGSRESQPGFALFSNGVLVEAGTIRVTPGDNIHKRLYELRRSLMEDFSPPNMLITENLPPFMSGGFNKSVLNLHYSVGVIMSVFLCPCARVHPRGWRAHIDESRYIKSDVNDAIMLGYTAIHDTCSLLGIPNTQNWEAIEKITHRKA